MRSFGKLITSFLLATAFVLVDARNAFAANLIVNCPNSTTYAVEDVGASCVFQNSGTSISSEALFSVRNLAPGETVSQTISVNNNDLDESCELILATSNEQVSEVNLASVLRTVIYEPAGSIYFGGYNAGVATATKTLQNLYDTDSVDLGVVPANSSRVFDWIITLDGPSVGNEFQGKTTTFDFDISFTCGDPTLTPTPTPGSQTSTSTTGSVAGTSTSFSSPSTPACDYPNLFPSAPTGFSVSAGTNTASLSWNAVDGANQYAIFFYDVAGREYSVLGSIIGNATSFTIGNLSGIGWSFELIAIGGNDNLCSSPRAFATAVIGGGVVTGPPVGPGGPGDIVEGDVLGEVDQDEMETEVVELERDKTLGATTSCVTWKMYLPWLLLIAQLLSLLIVEYFTRRTSSKAKYLYIILITALTNILFYLLRECYCYDLGSILAWLCKWFWVVSVLESLLIRLIGYGFIEVVDKD